MVSKAKAHAYAQRHVLAAKYKMEVPAVWSLKAPVPKRLIRNPLAGDMHLVADEKRKKYTERAQYKYLKHDRQTEKNTRHNARMFDTGADSVALYRRESLQDLIGRLHNDDFDLDLVVSSFDRMSPRSLPAGFAAPSLLLRISLPASLAASPRRSPDLRRHDVRSAAASLCSELRRGVSFDTTETSNRGITLKLRHPQFQFRRNNKAFLVAFDSDSESLSAAEWVLAELAVHGDTLIALHVNAELDQAAARATLADLESRNVHLKKLAFVLHAAAGKPQKAIEEAVEEYRPLLLVVSGGELHAKTVKHFLLVGAVPVIIFKHTPRGAFPHVDLELFFQKMAASVVPREVKKQRWWRSTG